MTEFDPYLCSIEELENEILRLESIKEEYFNLEQSIKIFINSIYGAAGSPYYEAYNVKLAEAVTLQGQDVAKYASGSLDDYFKNIWHLDTKLHAALGLTRVNKINEKTLTIYMDTDSCYVTFGPVLNSCDWQGKWEGKEVDFILKIKELRLNAYLKKKFEEYASKYNTLNIQDLELEKISYAAIMVAKKKYILDLAWKDPGVYFNRQEKIKHVGIEIVQGSTPKFARKVLKELVKMSLAKGKNLQYVDAVRKLKDYKKEYLLQSPDDIAKTEAIGDYEKYCLDDKKEVRLAPKCGINVRGAAVYNHIILNSKWKSKYNIIKTGDKLKYYYSKDANEVFGFLPNNFPYEFAPPVDYDIQFEKTIINPYNRVLSSMGFNPIPGNLIYAKSLF